MIQQQQPAGGQMPNIQYPVQNEPAKDQSDNKIKLHIMKTLAQNVVNDMVADEMTKEQKEEKKKNKEKSQSCFYRCCFCFTIEFYQPYFDVTSQLVWQRIKAAFNPFNKSFFQIQNSHRPDVYGPFWIYTTLVFCLAAAGNLAAYLQTPAEKKEQFIYNFQFVPFAFSVVYAFGIGIPTILTIIMKIFGTNQISFFQNFCIYGYSSACFIPVSLLCSIPGEQLQWFVMVYAMANSSLFLISNYNCELQKYVQNRKLISIGFILGTQFFLLLVYKLYFFKNIYSFNHNNLLDTNLLENTPLAESHYRKIIAHNI